MTPQEAEIVRLYTRNTGGGVPDNSITLSGSSTFEVVVEAEAGSALVGLGVPYALKIDALDITAGNNPKAVEPNFSQPGPGGDNFGTWTTPISGQHTEVFTVTISSLANVKNHIFRYAAMLTAGTGGNEVVTFAESPMFTIIA